MMSARLSAVLSLVFLIGFIAGCAGHSSQLLDENYKTMNNEQLLEYFYRLNDEIEKQEKQTGPSVGIGFGGFGLGRRGAIGSGVGVETGGTAYTADDLRQRRVEVRMEMKRRNITP